MTSPYQPYQAYPQPPQPQQPGPYAPDPAAAPARPDTMKRALRLMLAGAALSVVNGVVTGLTSHSLALFSFTSSSSGASVHHAPALASGIFGGVIDCGLWLWMTWKAGAGRPWARVLSTVFFGFLCLGLLISLVNVVGHARSIPALLVLLAESGVALAAIVLLYRPASEQFFEASKQARLAAAFTRSSPGAGYPAAPASGNGAGYPASSYPPAPGSGYPAAGYPQPPAWGQRPGYGPPSQPSAYGQPAQPLRYGHASVPLQDDDTLH
jgi:hypothetical protein